ncbi:MAG: hypothetical protein ACOCWI_03945 [Bacillota bacterium]
MKLVMVKFQRKGEGFLYLGTDTLDMHDAVLCRTKDGVWAGEVIDLPDNKILTENSGAYLPLKECVNISNEITYELWQEHWDMQASK